MILKTWGKRETILYLTLYRNHSLYFTCFYEFKFQFCSENWLSVWCFEWLLRFKLNIVHCDSLSKINSERHKQIEINRQYSDTWMHVNKMNRYSYLSIYLKYQLNIEYHLILLISTFEWNKYTLKYEQNYILK